MLDRVKTYEDGVLEGKLQAMESMIALHAVRLKAVEDKASYLERVAWILLGGFMLLQVIPTVKGLLVGH